jgi:acyl-coenzyme A thioesterase 13
MTSRIQPSPSADELQSPLTTQSSQDSERRKVWVDPASLPNHGDVATVAGNAPDYVKQLNKNTYMSYGVGGEDCFGHKVGRSVKFITVNIERNVERRGRLSATTVAEVKVSKCT